MLLASKHFTLVVGIDIHATTSPPFNPVQPFIGMVFDVGDYIPMLGCNTHINSMKRGGSCTGGMLVTMMHIPIVGPFVMSPIIGHESTNFFGGLNTYVEGERLSPAGFMIMTCNDVGIPLSFKPGKKFKPIPSLFAPTAMSIPIPLGAPVIVGGPYVPDFAAILKAMVMGFGFGCIMKGAGKGLKKGLTAFNHGVLKKQPQSKWSEKLSKSFCKKGFEPVNLVTGSVDYEGIDFELQGPLPLEWKREWTSDSCWPGALGHGCHWNFDMRIERFPEHEALAATLSDGRPAAFSELLPGESEFNRSEKLTLHHRGKEYELFDHAERISYFFEIVPNEKEYGLTRVQNEAGHSIRLIYKKGHIHRMIDSAGRNIWITTDKDRRITKAELEVNPHTRETLIEYAYNDEGDMTGITDALGQTTHIVYQNHLMVKKTDRNGQTFYWEYDGTKPKSRCIHTWGDGGILEGFIEYHKGYNLVTNSLGHVTRYDFTPEGYVTAETDPLGNRTLTDFTPEGDVMREIDAEGNITGFDYDDMGNMTAIHYPDGSQQIYLYDEDGRLKMEVTPEGASTIYAYNEKGLLDYRIAPDRQVSTYHYDEQNLVSKIISDKQEIELAYDRQHNLIEALLPDGMRSEWQYDHRGQVLMYRNPMKQRTDYCYDLLGRVISTTSPDGNEVTLAYNAYGEVLSARDKSRRVDFTYTPMGSLKTRKENGKTLSFVYDTEEQLKALRNEKNEAYRFGRDGAGRITAETGFDGLTRKYLRNTNGLVTKVERPGERFSEYRYDSLGQLCNVEYHDGSFERYTYNRDGLLTAAENAGSQLKIVRNKSGRIMEEWQDGHCVTSNYDKPGQRIGLSSSLGADLKMGYTTAGLLQNMQAGDWSAGLKYDERGLEIERVLSSGVVCRNEYDSVGRIRRASAQAGKTTTRKTYYQWGQNDRLICITNELTNKGTWFNYDTMGNLVSADYNRTEQLFRVPDAVGNLYKTEEQKDRKYGAGGRLLETEDTKYHYDEEGNLTEKAKGNGERWLYEWNANGSLKTVIRPDRKKVSFEYDALGRRTAKIFDKRITRWVWDGNTPLHEWSYALDERPKAIQDEFGFEHKDKDEPIENLITWVRLYRCMMSRVR